jgi:hypothetical protein
MKTLTIRDLGKWFRLSSRGNVPCGRGSEEEGDLFFFFLIWTGAILKINVHIVGLS